MRAGGSTKDTIHAVCPVFNIVGKANRKAAGTTSSASAPFKRNAFLSSYHHRQRRRKGSDRGRANTSLGGFTIYLTGKAGRNRGSVTRLENPSKTRSPMRGMTKMKAHTPRKGTRENGSMSCMEVRNNGHSC